MKLIVGAVVLVIAGVVGFFFINKGKTGNPLTSTTAGFTSIKDALSKSVSLECEFTDESGVKNKTFIKNGAIRADITAPTAEQSGSAIVKEKKMWFWNAQGGFVLTLPEDDGTDTAKADDKSSQADDLLEDLEQYKDQCKGAIVSDSLFTPPSDVQFTDMSSLVPQVPAGNSKSGSGDENNTPSQDDINKFLEQYQNAAPEE